MPYPSPIEILESRCLLSAVPSGFTQTTFASGLSRPTAMAFAPDGRLFVAEEGGTLRVVQNGQLLPTPFLSIPTDSAGERGLLGVAFDPRFVQNHYVYVYHTVPGTPAHNRVSRFTANGNVAVPGSEVDILDLNPLSIATNHNAGAIHLGADGKLYVAVGDNANGNNAQTLSNLLGKVLRINPDGSIPTDNPFYTKTTGQNRAIWALGLRNPFTFGVQPGTGRIFINDVGASTYEEIDDGKAGANYGWPFTEGPLNTNLFPQYVQPIYSYPHGPHDSTGGAITGGTFYNPSTATFPSKYVGKYFFADFVDGFVNLLDPATRTATSFGTNFSQPVDLEVGPDGAIYVLQHLTGQVTRIQSTATPVGRTATLSASSDAYVREGASANLNFGSATQLQTKASIGFGYNRQAYLTFSLSGVGSVQHAVLRLYGQLSQTDNPISVGVFGVPDTSWGERTITWNKRPAASSGAVAAATVSGTGPRWYEWDVTSYVKQQKGAGRSNVSLLLRNLVSSTGFVIFSSREAGNTGPQLVVTSS